jgi:hypothetical protein
MKLFPNTSKLNNDVLYTIYTNVFTPKKEIIKLAYVAHSQHSRAMRSALGDGTACTRLNLIGKLGYITVPHAVRSNWTIPNYLQNILITWKEDPGAPSKKIADSAGVAVRSVYAYSREIYHHFGYTPPADLPDYLTRLHFYWYMGWFDKPRLELEARIAYRKRYGQVRS